MIQTLHILRKDLRHLWPQLALYAVLLIAFAWQSPTLWQDALEANRMAVAFLTLVKSLIPVLWLVLTAQLIQDESLVGDQQFWITRPYLWPSLLGAKLLFIAAFIIAPFLLAQLYLVVRAGLNPTFAITGFLQSIVYFALILWLPFTVVSSVTSTVTRAFLSFIVIAFVWIGILTLIFGTFGERMFPAGVSTLSAILVPALLLAILVYQYARRNTLRSRLALAATFAGWFLAFILLASPLLTRPVNALIRHQNPLASNIHLTFTPDPLLPPDAASVPPSADKFATLGLPIQLTGLDPAARLHDVNAAFTLTASGYTYTAPFRPVAFTEHTLLLLLPSPVLSRLKDTTPSLHISVVAGQLLPGTPQTILATDHFAAPGHGSCISMYDRPLGRMGTSLICRYAFEGPPPTRIEAAVSEHGCAANAPSHPAVGNSGTFGPGTRPDPVIEVPFRLGGALCPGTPITFTTYHSAGNLRLDLDIPTLNLAHYTAP